MSLPIVIIFERHWDIIPKHVTQNLLPHLANQGYDTLCFEYPHEMNEAEVRANQQASLEFDSKVHAEAQQFLRRVNIIAELSEIDFSSLAALMQRFVSSKKYIEVAEKIKGLPASRIFEEILKGTRQLSFSLKGVDIDSESHRKMTDENLLTRMSLVRKLDSHRTNTMFQNLLKLKSEQHGIVFVCGAFHANSLLAKFAEQDMQDEVLYYFPHSASRYDSKVDDIYDILNESPILRGHDFLLSKTQVNPFVTSMIKDVVPKIRYQRKIQEENTHILFLNNLFKANFKAFLRPGYHVDALVDIDRTPHVETIEKRIEAQDIETRRITMDTRRYLVIPSVNTREVALKIRNRST